MSYSEHISLPSVRCGFESHNFSLVHFINTDISSGSYIDGRGILNMWFGFTWETLNTLNGENVYRTGFIGVLEKSVVFQCLTAENITDGEASNKRLSFYYISQVAPFVNYRELRALIDMKCKE